VNEATRWRSGWRAGQRSPPLGFAGSAWASRWAFPLGRRFREPFVGDLGAGLFDHRREGKRLVRRRGLGERGHRNSGQAGALDEGRRHGSLQVGCSRGHYRLGHGGVDVGTTAVTEAVSVGAWVGAGAAMVTVVGDIVGLAVAVVNCVEDRTGVSSVVATTATSGAVGDAVAAGNRVDALSEFPVPPFRPPETKMMVPASRRRIRLSPAMLHTAVRRGGVGQRSG